MPSLQIPALLLTLLASTGLSIGLTFAPCYATLCSEEYFAYETRLHLLIYYGLLAVTGCFLLLRVSSPAVRKFSGHYIFNRGPRITVGGLLASVWIVGVTAGTTSFWLPAQHNFWGLRADPLDWASAKLQLTITGLTGHYADILLGLLIFPVSRNSLLGRAFSLHKSTLLFAHKMIGYLFGASATAHGVTYILYATDSSSEGDEAKDEAFATGNPAITLSESKLRSEWFTTTTYIGIAAILPVWLIIVTSIPWVRRNHYNFFYYTHIICGIIVFVASCLHASTDFYLLLPGLFLWLADWVWRLFGGETHGLLKKTRATLDNADNGWLRISLPTQMLRTDTNEHSNIIAERRASPGRPLLYYYLNFPTISRFQNHAYTAAVPRSSETGPVFLLQSTTGKSPRRLAKEWTWKLANLVPDVMSSRDLDIRVEGPYHVGDGDFEKASRIVCIVGGTGITGAYSLARWWLDTSSRNAQLTLVWSIRNRESSRIREWAELEETARTVPNLTVIANVSSESGRVDPYAHLRRALEVEQGATPFSEGPAWVYSSGPESLISSTERACMRVQKNMKESQNGHGKRSWAVKDLSWYMAQWEV